jgi:hypothetical protein
MKCPNCGKERARGDKFCDGPDGCGFPLVSAQPSYRANDANLVTGEVRCPRQDCGRINPVANTFCYYCGEPLGEWVKILPEPRTSPPASPVKARLKLPSNSEITLATEARWLGRDDLNGLVPEHDLQYISVQHLIIRFENGQYYVEDQNSTNGTRLNGIEITGKGKYRLDNGDHIELAEVVTLTFKVT